MTGIISKDINMRYQMDTEQFVLSCKALGDSSRVEIMKLLSEGEDCACNLLEKLSITQSTLSHHMRILCESGLVSVRKDGKWSHYSLDSSVLEEFGAYADALSRARCGKGAICRQ
jgi:ArsR family transcriptional regulator